MISPEKLKTTFNDVAGCEEAKEEVSELVEYGEDFTDAATVIDNLQSAYVVGKGYLDKVIEKSDKIIENSDKVIEKINESLGSLL